MYTDGSYDKLSDIGGWSIVICGASKIETYCGAVEHTTSNAMELKAIVEALTMCVIRGYRDIEILSDSAYCINNIKRNVPEAWEKAKWRTSAGEDVKNAQYWKEFLSMYRGMKMNRFCIVTKVKGHVGGKVNDLADELARLQTKAKVEV